ncbi:hypothetical protein HY572_05725 [Candidatus Micrarchaeota archaeon]|nr:hypothetical protein [Candidatus Micrarchaeota archaeon]
MRLVVDSNRFIAALLRDSFSRRVLFSKKFRFFSIGLMRSELSKYEQELRRKSGLSRPDFEALRELMFSRLLFLEASELKPFMGAARAALDAVDPKDSPFLAAALAVRVDGIWSDDRHFERQRLVRVFKTKDLAAML